MGGVGAGGEMTAAQVPAASAALKAAIDIEVAAIEAGSIEVGSIEARAIKVGAEPARRRSATRRIPSDMTGADLVAWERRCGLRNDAERAQVLCMSLQSYRRKRSGRSPITGQEQLLSLWYEIHGGRWSQMLDALIKLARATDISPPRIGEEKLSLLAKLSGSTTFPR